MKLGVVVAFALLISVALQEVMEEFEAREAGSRSLLAPISFRRFDTAGSTMMMRFAVAVLFTVDDSYGSLSQGACKIARQVRRMTNVDLVMLTLRHHESMARCGWTRQVVVPAIDSPDPGRHDNGDHYYALGKVYTKLHLWNLTQYERVLYLDLDTLPVAQFAQLFEQRLDPHCDAGAMALDIVAVGGNPQYFNTGVMLVLPSAELWRNLVGNVTLVPHDPALADQNFLNAYLKGRICFLPRKYNCMVGDRAHFGPAQVIVHYTGIKLYSRFTSWRAGLNDLVAAWDLA